MCESYEKWLANITHQIQNDMYILIGFHLNYAKYSNLHERYGEAVKSFDVCGMNKPSVEIFIQNREEKQQPKMQIIHANKTMPTFHVRYRNSALYYCWSKCNNLSIHFHHVCALSKIFRAIIFLGWCDRFLVAFYYSIAIRPTLARHIPFECLLRITYGKLVGNNAPPPPHK